MYRVLPVRRRVTDCKGSDTLYRCIAHSQNPSQEAFVIRSHEIAVLEARDFSLALEISHRTLHLLFHLSSEISHSCELSLLH